MKKTELEYAEQLIEQYRIRMGSRGYQNFKSVCVQCAINDVTNTLEALTELTSGHYTDEIIVNQVQYYQTVLNILKEKV